MNRIDHFDYCTFICNEINRFIILFLEKCWLCSSLVIKFTGSCLRKYLVVRNLCGDIRLREDQILKVINKVKAVSMGASNLRKRQQVSGPAPLILPGMKSEKLQSDALTAEQKKPRDFYIKVEDQTMHVHKGVLCAVSDYFDAILESGMKESDDGEIRIQHARTDVVKTMIGYFYGEDTCIEWKEIRDYVDIVELWQLTEAKPILEDYIAKNISEQDCIEWFLYADAYHMENVVLKIIETFINTLCFRQISRSEDFRSLSLSDLISLISHKEVIHRASILNGCIRWIQEDESSRKPYFSILLSHIRLTECYPGYLKHMLITYSDSLITDKATQAQIQEMIASSIILIGPIEKDRWWHVRKVFCVNMAHHTVIQIDKCLEWLFSGHANLCCNTDSGILFYSSGGYECGLLDLVSLNATKQLSLKNCVSCMSAVPMGSKIFMTGPHVSDNGRYSQLFCTLGPQDKH